MPLWLSCQKQLRASGRQRGERGREKGEKGEGEREIGGEKGREKGERNPLYPTSNRTGK